MAISLTTRDLFAEENTLTIYNTKADDSGLYKCAAWNQYSRSYHEEHVTIESKADARLELNALDNANNSWHD